MEKLSTLLFCAVTCILVTSSCMSNNADTSLTLTESDHYYSMYVYFNKGKTREVEKYMDSRIGRKSNMSFVNTQIDGTVALDDHTTFYIKKFPGFIKLKLDKNENSYESYHQVKAMCEGIEKVLK